MANFTTKTIKEIYESFISKYTVLRSKYGDESPLLEKSLIKTIGYAIAGIAGNLWQLAVWIYKQCFPQTCSLSTLKYWGNLIGVDYNDGQTANIVLKLSGVTASSLPSGTIYKDLSTGLIYKTVSEAWAEDGIIYTTAECTKSGTAGNIAVDTVLNIANPLDGIPSTAVVYSISVEGTEDEDVETYRSRVLYNFRNKTQTGSFSDYYSWVMEVSGIVDALVYVVEEGTVTIYCVADGSGIDRTPSGYVTPNPFPEWADGQFTEFEGEGQFLQIAYAVEGTEEGAHDRRPLMAAVDLQAPVYAAFSINIEGLTDTSYNTQIIEALIEVLDAKRPNITALGYTESDATINALALSSTVSGVIGTATFTSFVLYDSTGTSISETLLDIGELACLSELTINGTVVYTAEDDETEEDEEEEETEEDTDE